MRLIRFPVMLLSMALMVATVATAQDIVNRSFDVKSDGTLHIDADFGSVTIEPSSNSTVSVEMIRRVKDASDSEQEDVLEHHEYLIESRGSDVHVESKFDNDGNNGIWRRWKNDSRFSLEINITVPKTYNVMFKTGAANIAVADLDGSVRGKTGAGNIMVGRLTGTIEVSSGAGNIEVGGASGQIYVDSGAGNITLDEISGKIDVSTGAGNVVASITGALSGDSKMSSGAGNVTVYLKESVGANVDGKASVGSAKTDYDLSVKGKFMSKSFEGRVNGGGPNLTLNSGVGNVSLTKL